MTASDITAQALEYTSHIEDIRTKSGKLQGGLSGELKKRILCIEEFIRALQAKAESAGDPGLLKHKINQLLEEIRKNKIEEEKRKREMEDLTEVIKDLKRENKNIREELRKIRDDISMEKDRYSPPKNDKYSPLKVPQSPAKKSHDAWKEDVQFREVHPWSNDERSRSREDHQKSRDEKDWPDDGHPWSNDTDPHEDPAMSRPGASHEDLPVTKKNRVKVEYKDIVMRPPIGRVSTPIPILSQLKEERQAIVEQQLATLTKRNRPVIKIIENRQLIPPRNEREKKEEAEWTEVNRKGRKKSNTKDVAVQKTKTTKEKKDRPAKRKIPKTAAISIKGKSENFSYAEALKKARTEISLEDMEINAPRIRKGMNGATIIEISSSDNGKKADELACKIQNILKKEAYVSKPKVRGEIKFTGLDESIAEEEISWMAALEGDCCPEDVRVNSIRTTRSDLRMAWIKCPVEAAIKIFKKGKVKLGWTIVRAELL